MDAPVFFSPVDYQGKTITSRPAKESSRFKRGLTELAKCVDSRNVRALLDFAATISEAASLIFAEMKDGFAEAAKTMGRAIQVLSTAALIGHLQWWVCEKASRWQETASMVFWTTLGTLKSVLFLEELKAFSLAKIAINIGRGIPIVGLVINGVTAFAVGFGLWNDIKELKECKAKEREHTLMLRSWQLMSEGFQERDGAWQDSHRGLDSGDAKWLSEQTERMFGTAAAVEVESLQKGENKRKYIAMKFEHEIAKYTALIEQDKLSQKKAWIELANDVFNIFLVTLVLIGLCTGVGALAATGAFLITLGVISSSLWLYKCVYHQMHKQDPHLLIPAHPTVPRDVAQI